MREKVKIAAGIALALGLSTAANAAVYDVTAVLNGTQGGFAFSGFHFSGENTSSSNSRDYDGKADTGTGLMDITSVISGSYDTSGGVFNAVFGLADASTVSVSGSGLDFDGSGLLLAGSSLDIDFSAANTASLYDTTIFFAPGYVCCGSNGTDPNSFLDGGSSDKLMSLWGANDSRGYIATDSSQFSEIGLDLRIELTAVPVPAAVWLFGSGLLGLIGIARRRV